MPIKNKNKSSTINDDLDVDEFKEDYPDDLQDETFYNEVTSESTNVLSTTTTRQSSTVHNNKRIWILFSFLTRPPIAAGILAGK
jgi:hypothetical protein